MGIGSGRRHLGNLGGRVLLLALGFSLMLSSAANADLYLHFDGITGSCVVEGYEGWSQIEYVSWGVTQSSGGSGGAGGAGEAYFNDLSWGMDHDQSVTSLFYNIAIGRHIRDATVDFTFNVAGDPHTYFQMYFEDVFLTSLSLQGTSSSLLSIAGAFSYSFIKLTYTMFDEDGKPASQRWASFDLERKRGDISSLAALFIRGMGGPTVVSAVPILTTWWLFGSTLIGLTVLRRQRKK